MFLETYSLNLSICCFGQRLPGVFPFSNTDFFNWCEHRTKGKANQKHPSLTHSLLRMMILCGHIVSIKHQKCEDSYTPTQSPTHKSIDESVSQNFFAGVLSSAGCTLTSNFYIFDCALNGCKWTSDTLAYAKAFDHSGHLHLPMIYTGNIPDFMQKPTLPKQKLRI